MNINESSLSRIYRKTENFDVGAITAFRDTNVKSKNKELNKDLLAYLLKQGYSITKVKGAWFKTLDTGERKEVGEESFFVVDHKNTGNLEKDLIKLGKYYDQDSILFVPKGKQGFLYGTSKREESFPGFDKKEIVGKPVFGEPQGEFFSRIRGRKFAFEKIDEITEMKEPETYYGKMALHRMYERVLKNLQFID